MKNNKLMLDKFVTKDLADELKKLGFNEPCFAYYTKGSDIFGEDVLSFNMDYAEVYSKGSYIRTDESGVLPLMIINSDYFIPTAPLWEEALGWCLCKIGDLGISNITNEYVLNRSFHNKLTLSISSINTEYSYESENIVFGEYDCLKYLVDLIKEKTSSL